MLQYLIVVDEESWNAARDKLVGAGLAPIIEFDLAEPLYQDFLEMEQDWIDSAGHGSFPPLAESTVRRKIAKGLGPAADIRLVETGRLKFSLTIRGAEDAIFEVRPTEALFGTKTPYASYHMHVHGNTPARPPIPVELPEKAQTKMDATITKRLREYSTEIGFLGYQVGVIPTSLGF